MLDFLKNYIAKREARSEYQHALRRFLSDGRLEPSHERYLEQLAFQYGLEKTELRRFHQEATSAFFDQIASDETLNDEEKKALKSVIHIVHPETSDFDFSKESFSRHYWLSLIDDGILPTLEAKNPDIVLQKKEVLHWSTGASLKKWKRLSTTAVNLGDFGGSVRLTSGSRYQMGSLKSTPMVQEVLESEDTGTFWLTNRRVGFVGQQKSFAVSYGRASSFDFFQDGVAIRVEGRKNPHILGLVNAEFSAAVLSAALRVATATPTPASPPEEPAFLSRSSLTGQRHHQSTNTPPDTLPASTEAQDSVPQ
jgi:hypothetical protein